MMIKACTAILALAPLMSACAQTTTPAREKDGCCDDPAAATCCAPKAAAPEGPARPVTVLTDSLDPVRRAFNAHADKPRIVALVSPVCSECVLGAQAVRQSVLDKFPGVEAVVVWTPMVEGDSEESARASSAVFQEGVPQFFDGKNLAGWAYQRAHFLKAWDEVNAALPPDHWLRSALERHDKQSPQWDLYMVYRPGARWEGGEPPRPDAFIRHLGRTTEGPSCYFRDRFTAPPEKGDLFDAMEAMARETIKSPRTQGNSPVPIRIQVLGRPDCPNTPAMQQNVQAALSALHGAEIEEVDLNSLPEGDARRGWPTPTVLVNGADLFGMSAPRDPSPGCRLYAGGIPTASAIEARLRELTVRP